MKKIANLLLISILIFSLTACSEKTNIENKNINIEQTETNNEKIEDHVLSISTEIDDKITEEKKYNTTIVVSKDIIFEDANIFLEIVNNYEEANTDKYMEKLEKFADAKYDKKISEKMSSNPYIIANANTYATTKLLSEQKDTFYILFKKIIDTNITTTERSLGEILKKIKNNFNITIENNKEFIDLHKEIFKNKTISEWNINIKDEKDELIDIIISVKKPQLSDPSINVKYIYN